MKLTMNRKGSFRCEWFDTTNKCGIGPTRLPEYTYQCHIETADILDPNGFVFDQLKIDEYFQQKYRKQQHAQSCERIAVSACGEIRRMIENHMLGHNGMSVIYRIAVTIGVGNEGPATMTAEWVPDLAKPIANVKRRKKPEIKPPSYDTVIVRPKSTNPPDIWDWSAATSAYTRRLP